MTILNTYLAIGWLLAVPMVLRIIRSVLPLKVDPTDTSRFALVARGMKIHTVTGRAHDLMKGSTTTVTGGSSSSLGADGSVQSVSGSVRSETTIHDQLMVTDADGNEHSFQLTDFNIAVGAGQKVSVAWAIPRFRKRGAYFLVVNHATNRRYFRDKALDEIIINHRFLGNIQVVLNCIFLPVPFLLTLVWAVTYRLQRGRFKRSGVTALVRALDERAAAMPAPRSTASDESTADELERLAKMAREGSLTDEEWTQAKERVLGTSSTPTAGS